MTRMTGSNCAVMCNLIKTHTDGSEDGNESGSGDWDGEGTGIDREREQQARSDIRHIRQERNRVEDHALPFLTRHHFCRQEVAPAGNQKLRAQDPAPAR